MLQDRAEDEVHEAIVIIDDEPFSQECVIEALRGSFPHATMIGILSVEDLYHPEGMSVSLVLINAKSRFLTGCSITDVLKTVARYIPKAPVVLISVNDDDVSVFEAIAAGVQGVVPVSASLKIGVAALRLVMAGGTYYPRPVLNPLPSTNETPGSVHADATQSPLLSSLPALSPPGRKNDLSREARSVANAPAMLRTNGFQVSFTTREAEVLAALQRGRSNKWIANHLNLSENTVKVHIRHIMRKLHATNRTEAVILSQHFALTMHEEV